MTIRRDPALRRAARTGTAIGGALALPPLSFFVRADIATSTRPPDFATMQSVFAGLDLLLAAGIPAAFGLGFATWGMRDAANSRTPIGRHKPFDVRVYATMLPPSLLVVLLDVLTLSRELREPSGIMCISHAVR